MGYLGEIRMFAGTFAPSGWAKCDGSTLTIEDYPEFASYIGKTYGGDGLNTVGLPNLGANAPLHASGVNPMGQTSSGPIGVDAPPSSILYLIALTTPPSNGYVPFVGEVRTFSFGAVPHDWALCDGSILNIKDNPALYALLENQYGGSSDEGTFALPDLRGNTVKPVAASDPLGYVVMNFCIATAGTFPSES
jgi:microcystin-dependent protein